MATTIRKSQPKKPSRISKKNSPPARSSSPTSDLTSKEWRLDHLYRIIDKNGNSIRFVLNDVQREVLRGLHKRNLVLKARQLGLSTFSVLYLVDEVIFEHNVSGGIVSYSLEHAQHIFKRIIGHALETFLPEFKPYLQITQHSAREISFANGSFLRVDTTLRGGAYKLVLVSEFGKTCARNPMKAEEVVTGTLQTVSESGTIIIESTGEGDSGFYADMINQANEHQNKKLSALEYKLFFFPWFKDPTYQTKEAYTYDIELTDYFNELKTKHGVDLSQNQKNWYALQRKLLGDKIKQEFPSLVSEAFSATSDAFYFQEVLQKAKAENRFLNVSPYDPLEKVYIAMDIGINHFTVIIFFQIVHGEVRIIDFYADTSKGVDFYVHFLLQEKRYIYHTIFLPHDSKKRDGIVVENSYQREFAKLFSHAETRIQVLPRCDKDLLINQAKNLVRRCVFNYQRVSKLIDKMMKYRKVWSEQYGRYIDKPYDGEEADFADAFQYVAQAVSHIEAVSSLSQSKALENHRKVVRQLRRRV